MAYKLYACFALALLLALQTRGEARACAIVGPDPGRLEAPAGTRIPTRFDLLSSAGKLLGRQIVFSGSTGAALLLSPEAKAVNNDQPPRVRCAVDNETVLKPRTVVDVGPQIDLLSLYLGRDALTVSFYAYQEDFFASRKDEGVNNQLFSVRLDGRSPTEVQVTAKPGQIVTVRFENVVPGTHRLAFGEMELGGRQMRYYTTELYELDFTQPEFVSGLR